MSSASRCLGSGREADEVGEEDGDELALRRRRRARGRRAATARRRAASRTRRRTSRVPVERRAARQRTRPRASSRTPSRTFPASFSAAAARAGHALTSFGVAEGSPRSSQGVASSRSKISRASASRAPPRRSDPGREPLGVLELRHRQVERQRRARGRARGAVLNPCSTRPSSPRAARGGRGTAQPGRVGTAAGCRAGSLDPGEQLLDLVERRGRAPSRAR